MRPIGSDAFRYIPSDLHTPGLFYQVEGAPTEQEAGEGRGRRGSVTGALRRCTSLAGAFGGIGGKSTASVKNNPADKLPIAEKTAGPRKEALGAKRSIHV